MTKYEKISTVLGSFGLISGLLALVVSYFLNQQSNTIINRQIELETELRKSKIVIQIERDPNQGIVIFNDYRDHFGKYSAVYKQKYTVIINNIGIVNASITSWDIDYIIRSKDSTNNRYGWFDGMGPWFYNEKLSSIELPLKVSPNDPRKIIVEVGVKVPTAAWNEVNRHFQFGKSYDYEDAESFFLERKHPFFGQLNEIDDMSYGDTGNLQEYILTLTKGDGSRISAEFYHNINDLYIQGENM